MPTLLNTPRATEQLEADIRNQIASGRAKNGTRILPERELAQQYNLNCGSVRKVLLRLVDEGLLIRNGRSGTRICVEKTVSKTIAFNVFSSLRFSSIGASPYLEDIYRGIEQEALRIGWDVAMQMGNASKERLAALKNNGTHWADGIILCGTGMPDMVANLMKTSMPFVVVDYPNIQGVNNIFPDNINGGSMAVSHLQGLKHEKNGFLYPLLNSETEMQAGIKARFLGYQDAMDRKINDKWICGVNVGTDYKLSADGEATLREYLSSPERPTAVFVPSDSIMPEFYRVAQDLRLRIPDDISVVGFEGLALGETLNPSLTTVHVDRVTMGKLAIQRLKALFDGETTPISQILPVNLIVRNSTSPRPS